MIIAARVPSATCASKAQIATEINHADRIATRAVSTVETEIGAQKTKIFKLTERGFDATRP
jgi:hypothetical protein